MSRPSVHADRDHDILVNVEWRADPLSKHVEDIVIGVRAVMKIRAECRLPFLRLQDAGQIRRAKDEALKLQLSNSLQFRSRFQREIREVAHTIVALDETNLRLEVLPDAAACGDAIYEIRPIAHRA